jgi:hypothetical protein
VVTDPDFATVFNYPHGSTQGLLNCIQTVGGLVSKFGSFLTTRRTLIARTGLILGPYMADYGGRKWTIFLGCCIVVIAGILQCFSINIHMFTAARFLSMFNHLGHARSFTDMGPVGMGSGFSGLGSPLLITELAHPAERGKITALYKYVLAVIPAGRCYTNTGKALNTTSVLSSEAVSRPKPGNMLRDNSLTMIHRDHIWYTVHQLELVLEIAKFATSSAFARSSLPGLPASRVSSLACVERQKRGSPQDSCQISC